MLHKRDHSSLPGPDAERRYDGVLFDVGGTLIGFFDRQPFREFLAEAGLPAGEEDAAVLHRRFVAALIAGRERAGGKGAEDGELFGWWRGIFGTVWPDRSDLAADMERWLVDGRFDRAFADAVPTLEALAGLGIRLGVVSNFVGYLDSLLARLGLRGYFEFVVVSALVGLAKPDPRIFDLAVAQAGLPRGRLLYVGDHQGDDIAGAGAAGLDAVLIDRAGRYAEALCPRISHLTDLVKYVYRPAAPALGVLFDLDGVILDSLPDHLISWKQALAPLGVEPTAADLYPLEGAPTERIGQLLTEKLLGRACSGEDARRLAETKRLLFRQSFEPRFFGGILSLLHDLHGRGYRLGLVTGSHRSLVDHYLAPAGLDRLFDAIVTGDEVVSGKPHPEPYLAAALQLGLAPAECLVVENSPFGLASAEAAGMDRVALETTLPACMLGAASRVFPDVPSLRGWFLAQWGR